MRYRIVVKDELNHKKFSWPLTLLSYPISFPGQGVQERDWDLQNEQEEKQPFQIDNIVKENGLVKSLCLYFLCDLSTGEEKVFYFIYGDGKNLGYELENVVFCPDFQLEVKKEEKCFQIKGKGGSMVCHLNFESIESKVLSEGSLFQETLISCYGKKEEEYHLKIRCIHEMPFWELEEEMKGFEPQSSDQMEMRMDFEQINFVRRYSWQRPVEKIDSYLTDDYKIPVTIMPFENWNPWFQSKYIAFLGEELSVGLFIRDNEGWDDYEYPIWGSNKEFGITFRYQNGHLEAIFPLKNGKRFSGIALYPGNNSEYIKYLWLWYAHLNLNKTKDWILKWEEKQPEEPSFFVSPIGEPYFYQSRFCKKGEVLFPDIMLRIVDQLSPSINNIGELNPVDNREFSDWAVFCDLTAKELSGEEYNHVRAAFAFMAYATKDENYMPTKHMLAGHPNFLSDTAAVSGFFGALFPNHPQSKEFRSYFQRVVELNLKYHIRPDVEAYQSLGGRATENLACYNFASLIPIIRVCILFWIRGYGLPVNCKQGAKWLNWMTNCLSAPIDGRRIFPPQGAHAAQKGANGFMEIPYVFYVFAQMLYHDYPELSASAMAACKNSSQNIFICNTDANDIWKTLFIPDSEKYELRLGSEKFTGYGFILREKVGTDKEISIHIQQLDQGPNYRWGTFQNTGNGGIYYYAAGKRYSFNCQEDAGDRNIGAEEGSCNFCVLKGHTYYNIGFHDLTEPFWNFPQVKQVKLLAEEDIKAFYKFRRVMLVESDYIVLLDAVTHMRARGRFVWSVNELDEFPKIFQLKPGVNGISTQMGKAIDYAGDDGLCQQDPLYRSRSLSFDGCGNFLTIVSHRKDILAKETKDGAEIILPERKDYIFEDDAECCFKNEYFTFQGRSAVISIWKDKTISGALLEGKILTFPGISLSLLGYDGRNTRKCAISFENKGACWSGLIQANETSIFCINYQNIKIEKGTYKWIQDGGISITRYPDKEFDPDEGFVRDTRKHEFGFYGTDFSQKGGILKYPNFS